jgi:hypothetical protein
MTETLSTRSGIHQYLSFFDELYKYAEQVALRIASHFHDVESLDPITRHGLQVHYVYP